MKTKYLFFSLIGIMSVACSMDNNSSKELALNSPMVLSNPSEYSQAVFLTKDHKNNPVIVWSSAQSDSGEYVLNYKKYNANNASFEDIVKVDKTIGMQAHHESMAKIGFKSKLYKAFFIF